MNKLKGIKGSLGVSSTRYLYCEVCLATFDVGWSIPYLMYNFDTSKCIFCAAKEKIPTPKATQEQITIKKEQLKLKLK